MLKSIPRRAAREFKRFAEQSAFSGPIPYRSRPSSAVTMDMGCRQTIPRFRQQRSECFLGYLAPAEWVFEDDGYSGANLLPPGLEALRDLAAQGQIEAALAYEPDRLSRKYAYQVLLREEFSRCGVSLVFLKSPSGETPEDQLLVQFQGMIAEYERTQIAERTRRGKRHKAQQGLVNVLSRAPYGYSTDRLHTGVWLSNVPLDSDAGLVSDAVLQVTLSSTDDELEQYEWIAENWYREWLLPGAVVNRSMTLTVIDDGT